MPEGLLIGLASEVEKEAQLGAKARRVEESAYGIPWRRRLLSK